jgi:hypothetical protein
MDAGWLYDFRRLEYRHVMAGAIGLVAASVVALLGVVAIDIVAIVAAKPPSKRGRSLAVVGLCLAGFFALALPGAVNALGPRLGLWRHHRAEPRDRALEWTRGELAAERRLGLGATLDALIAVKVLGEVGGPGAAKDLGEQALRHRSAAVRAAALAELSQLARRLPAARPLAAESAVRCLADPEEVVRRFAERLLEYELRPEGAAVLRGVLDHGSEAEKSAARDFLMRSWGALPADLADVLRRLETEMGAGGGPTFELLRWRGPAGDAEAPVEVERDPRSARPVPE